MDLVVSSVQNISFPQQDRARYTRTMNPTSSPRALLFLLPWFAAGCGAAVTPASPPPVEDTGAVDVAATPTLAPPTCAEVQAACGPEPQRFVRGHAEGLTGLDGARVRFAIRYLPRQRQGQGLDVAHGVAVASGEVRGGGFEACVCIPEGGSRYPQVAAVVFTPGTAGETSRAVARAMLSQRYATLGDENVSYALGEAPSPAQVEAALAALVDRTHDVQVRGLDAAAEGGQAYAGLVADERPVAAQVVGGRVRGGAVALDWIMPGRPWPSERLALLIDRNRNRRCDDGDLGTTFRLDGRRVLDGPGGPWARGAALQDLCRSLSIEADRER